MIGCPEIKISPDMWMTRENNENEMEVGCASSEQKWKLICDDTKWVGMIGNCSQTSMYAKFNYDNYCQT